MRFKLHLRTDKRPCPSFSGLSVFATACGLWVILAATTDRREAVECGNCHRREKA